MLTRYIGNQSHYTIPDFVTSVDSNAFADDIRNLTSITIHSGVTSIESSFSGCSNFASFVVDENNQHFSSQGGFLCDKAKTTLICAPRGLAGNIVIPPGVTSIGASAFANCSKLEQITVTGSVMSIGDNAFINCTGLRSIAIPSSVTSIGVSAFYSCTSLQGIIIPSGVTSIGERTFWDCTNLTDIVFAVDSRLTSIGKFAFVNCSSLQSVVIPANLTDIDYYAFSDCVNLTNITFAGNSRLTWIGGGAFSFCSSLISISIPVGVVNVDEFAFSSCTDLTSVMFAENSQLSSVGFGTFQDCSGLQSIAIPSTVTSIGAGVFKNCTALQMINVSWTNPPTINSTVFEGVNKADITVIIPAGTTQAYIAKGWAEFNLVEDLPFITTQVSGGVSITGVNGTLSGNVEIPATYNGEAVVAIGNNAFENQVGITGVTVPNTVTSIGESAFSGCSNLTRDGFGS
jgi:hypothetical protein